MSAGEHVRAQARADRLARQMQAAWARSQHVMAETRMLAGVMAATEEMVAVTFAQLAERSPEGAGRRRRLSEQARSEAMHLRGQAQASSLDAALGDPIPVSETRACEQCGVVFTPRREHARFCSSSCRDSWNRERGGDPSTGASALSWTVTAMRSATEGLARAGPRDTVQALEAISEAVWWVTIVDATLVRHHLEASESVLEAQPPAERRLIDGTLGGLRFVRNQMGYHLDHADFIEPGGSDAGSADGPITAWSWKSVPEPALGCLAPRGQAWEMARYRAYEAHLAGHTVGEVFGRAAAFLKLASGRAARGQSHPPASGADERCAAPRRAARTGRAGPNTTPVTPSE